MTQHPSRSRRRLAAWAAGAVVALWALRHIWLAATAVPAPVIDYRAEIEALVASHQPEGADGWALFVEAVRHLAPVRSEIEGMSFAARDPADGVPLLDFWRVHETRLDLSQIEPEVRALELLEARGAIDLLRRAAACPRAVRSIDVRPSPLMLDTFERPELVGFRELTRVLAARGRLAASAGDSEGRAESFELGLAVGRASAAQAVLLDQLVGMSVVALTLRAARWDLMEHGVDVETGRRMLDALDRQTRFPTPSLPFEAERLMVHDTIRSCFSDDGHGDGRFDVGSLERLSTGAGSRAKPALTSRIAGLFLASRAETTELVDAWYGALARDAELPPEERGAFNFTAFESRLTWRHSFMTLMLSWASSPVQRFDMLAFDIAAMRVHLAIEVFRAENGRLPERLDELVLPTMREVQRDPTYGGPLVYRRLATDAHGRTYILGSTPSQPDSGEDGALVDSADSLGLARDFTDPRPERTERPPR